MECLLIGWHRQRFGKGTWIDTDGARYDGKWVKGRREGSGVMTYANGSKFSGNWQRDRRHGKVLSSFHSSPRSLVVMDSDADGDDGV
jgi:hypothetical protein